MKSLKSLRHVHPFLSACLGITLFACTSDLDVTYGEADTSSAAPYDGEPGEVGVATAELGVEPSTPAAILWTDSIQTSNSGPFGFNQIQLERPIGKAVGGSDQVNLTRVPNPIGAGFALKHVANFDNNGGARAQAGIYSFANKTFEQQVKRPEGVWIAQEWYFPKPLSAGSKLDSAPWVNLWDFHSVGAGERWDTQPGLMLAEDGSMRVKWTWRKANPETAWSQVTLPVGKWFDVEMHYVWSASGATVSLWVDGKLALQQNGVKTKGSTHNSVETYTKFYGSANGGPSWNPAPAVKYTRNTRISGQRIWRDQPAAPVTPTPVPPKPVAPAPPLASILWTDSIQTSNSGPFGFNQIQLERPIGKAVGGSDQVNLTRVPNPIGAGFALKHVANFDNNGGARAQGGIYSFANKTFDKQVKSQEGIWIAQEWYFPQPLSAGNKLDSAPWVNLWDFHSVGAGERWDTQPGLMLAEDGSMRVKWTWRKENPETAWSQIHLPVGRWFDVEMHYVWSASGGTVSLWVDGKLALEQHGVKTKGNTHNSVETYMKFYGSANGGPSWSPSPSVKYTRNVRMSNKRIWR
jgi:hypothetical protein